MNICADRMKANRSYQPEQQEQNKIVHNIVFSFLRPDALTVPILVAIMRHGEPAVTLLHSLLQDG
jgi:hypothetical protein